MAFAESLTASDSGISSRPDSSRTQSTSQPFLILLLLIAFRILNALSLRTFFQPDEFFQSLEPAWQIVFGHESGAWITWEWKHQLRSSIIPYGFAAIYATASFFARVFQLPPPASAELLIVAPKVTQGVIAALGDYYSWKLARRIYGFDTQVAWTTLVLTALSPWQWFCATRTLSNCLETTLTVMAWYWWPWAWHGSHRCDSSTSPVQKEFLSDGKRAKDNGAAPLEPIEDRQVDPSNQRKWSSFCRPLLFAALASVLRPTNVLIWLLPVITALFHGTWRQRGRLIWEAACYGSSVVGVSLMVDRLYYGTWTIPPLKFLYFNLAQSLAGFYGKNVWHYYLSQGYPLLLTTTLPFAAIGLYQALSPSVPSRPYGLRRSIQRQLAGVCLLFPFILSLIAHKEVRFIYPLLPALHILASPPLRDFAAPAIATPSTAYLPRRLVLIFILLVNIAIAWYTTISHASGALSVLSYLRQQHQIRVPLSPQVPLLGGSPSLARSVGKPQSAMTVGFLMPCHSTPWRSHLVFSSIHAWALSCEPPVGLNATQKATYRDEADEFYDNPGRFLQHHMTGGLWRVPHKPSYLAPPGRTSRSETKKPSVTSLIHVWPDYLVFFAQLEPTLQNLLLRSSYRECWRIWNTAWHDDWRRRGDIVVWCLDLAEQQEWRNQKRKLVAEQREQQFDRIIDWMRRGAITRRWWESKTPIPFWGRWTVSSWTPPSKWTLPWPKHQSRKQGILYAFRLPSWPWASRPSGKRTASSEWRLERRLWS